MFGKEILMILAGLILVLASSVEAQVLWIDTGDHVWTDQTPHYSEVFLRNDVTLDVVGGSMNKLSTLDNSVANLNGGQIAELWTTDNSVVHYHSGQFDSIAADDSSVLFLYAYDVRYEPLGGLDNRGYVEGLLYNNDVPFSFSLQNTQSWEHIEIVPEPATSVLLGFGALVMRKRK